MSMREELQEKVGKPHLSYSSLKYALGDMRLWEMYMRGQLKKKSEALTFGGLYDTVLLEPDNLLNRYAIASEESLCEGINSKNPKLTKVYKDRLKEFEDMNSDKEIVLDADHKKAVEMVERLKDTGLYYTRIGEGDVQVEFNIDLDGIPVKGFLDCLHPSFIVDSKSTRSINSFGRDVGTFSYDIQAYIYTTVFDINDFYWLVQEKSYPYYPADVKCTDKTLFSGEMKFHDAVSRIKKWLSGKKSTSKYYAEFEV
tara:strand:- start:1900 stop:2664 length:765 start_codon:yes stop_codon:yes gene_type:complete